MIVVTNKTKGYIIEKNNRMKWTKINNHLLLRLFIKLKILFNIMKIKDFRDFYEICVFVKKIEKILASFLRLGYYEQ